MSTRCCGLVGKPLLNEIVAMAKARGFHTVIAHISDTEGASVALHQACGFKVVGGNTGRPPGRWLDVTVMQHMLRRPTPATPVRARRLTEKPNDPVSKHRSLSMVGRAIRTFMGEADGFTARSFGRRAPAVDGPQLYRPAPAHNLVAGKRALVDGTAVVPSAPCRHST